MQRDAATASFVRPPCLPPGGPTCIRSRLGGRINEKSNRSCRQYFYLPLHRFLHHIIRVGGLPLGPDTYRIHSSRGMGGFVAAEKEAIEEGNRYCTQQSKQFMAIGSTTAAPNRAQWDN